MAQPQRNDDDGWVPADTWGARLALVRQAMGWNYLQAAQACGVDDESWRQWERGPRRPQRMTEVAGRIADATGVSYVWLLAGGRLSQNGDSPFALALIAGEGLGDQGIPAPRPQLTLVP